jgi:CheY-like chemotaxis protein
MDLQMPLKNGYEASKEIREIESKLDLKTRIPIVALTATTFPSDIQEAKKVGMNDALFKPLQKYELERCVWR